MGWDTIDNSMTDISGTGEDLYPSSVSEKVVQAVADREEVNPTELNPPLYNAVNPESLNSLFENKDASARLEFHWLNYRIVVFSSGSIRVIDEGIEVLEK